MPRGRPERRGAPSPRAEAAIGRREAASASWSCPFPVGDGDPGAIELSARPTFSKQGRFIGYHGVGSDVTEARQAADRIAHMARHDALTGLPNRLQLLDNLGAALEQAPRRAASECAVLLVDLDRFKTINDSASAMSPATICCSRSRAASRR